MTDLSLIALVVSIIALVSGFISNKYENASFMDQVYQRFAQMWFDMDQIFIQHPHMHKYFYRDSKTGSYADINPDSEDFELALCIVEMFSDIFQYTEPLEKYLLENDKNSYNDYKKMINASPAVKYSKEKYHWNDKEM